MFRQCQDLPRWFVVGIACLLAAASMAVARADDERTRIALIGDSTMTSYIKPPADRPDLTGWGQVLGELFSRHVEVQNHAASGRSSKSFLAEQRWQPVLNARPDYVFIQFGHNDQPGKGERATDPEGDFRDNLRRYIRDAKAAGATAILVTPVARRTFQDGKPYSTLGPYAQAMKVVGEQTNTPVIDLHAASLELFRTLGDEGSADLSASASDRTHFSRKGALEIARLVAEALPEAAPELARYRKSPEQLSVYLGTYTRGDSKGIYHCRLNLKTGQLSEPTLAAEMTNPSFLALHPNGRLLYAVGEVANFQQTKAGAVAAFAIDGASGNLKPLNVQSSRGGGPCDLIVDATGRQVLVANYGGGSIASLPVEEDGKLGEAAAFVQHQGSSVDARRQEAPHAHCIRVSPDNRFVFVADLGLDKVLVYRFQPEPGTLTPHDPPAADVKPGAGPRHFSFHPSAKFAYVINEMDSTITAFAYDAQRGVLQQVQTISTLPAGFQGNNSTAELQVSSDGRFLYGSNRGHHSIAVFAIDQATGKLMPVQYQATGGRTPRNFALSPDGRYLLAANQDTDNVVVFRVDGKTGRLTATDHSVKVTAPVCVLFQPASQPH